MTIIARYYTFVFQPRFIADFLTALAIEKKYFCSSGAIINIYGAVHSTPMILARSGAGYRTSLSVEG